MNAGEHGPGDADGPGERQPTAEDGRPIARAFWVSLGVAGSVALTVFAWRWAMRPAAPAPVEPASVAGPAPTRARATTELPFEDVTDAWGIDFRRTDGADGRRLLPETMGGGVAVWDVDADGDLDLLFVDGDAWPDAPAGTPHGQGIVVFVNRGRETTGPRFVRATDTGLGAPRQAMGVAMADLDGDGRPEILETGIGGVRLFAAERAPGGSPPRWRDVTRESGLSTVPGWTTAAGFADFDADGDLDVVLGRYVEWSAEIDFSVGYTLTGIGRAYGAPNGFRGTDVAFLEQVAPMRFEDRSGERGFVARNRATGEPLSKSLGFAIADVDTDGDLDVFVANDTVQNLLFVNDGLGRFAERGVESGIAFDRNGAATGAMGCDASHLRNDRALHRRRELRERTCEPLRHGRRWPLLRRFDRRGHLGRHAASAHLRCRLRRPRLRRPRGPGACQRPHRAADRGGPGLPVVAPGGAGVPQRRCGRRPGLHGGAGRRTRRARTARGGSRACVGRPRRGRRP